MPRFWEIESSREFAAAHKLNQYDGKCANLHGHNWKVQMRLQVLNLRPNGISVDFGELKAIVDKYDHKCLNEMPDFTDKNSTAENISEQIASDILALCEQHDIGMRRLEVTVFETEMNKCTHVLEGIVC